MSASNDWPVKLMSTEYSAYPWPYGARALIAERANVGKVLELSAQMRYGWAYGPQPVVFQVPLSFHEGFVSNDNERLKLIDRVRTYHNFNWKRDTSGTRINQMDGGMTPAERHYNKLINNLLEMQALTEELKIETLALVVSCTNAHELQQAMLNARA
jgi:hypothetical protein